MIGVDIETAKFSALPKDLNEKIDALKGLLGF
jgi:hypothetical protein